MTFHSKQIFFIFLNNFLTVNHTIPHFKDLEKEANRKHCGKGENAGQYLCK